MAEPMKKPIEEYLNLSIMNLTKALDAVCEELAVLNKRLEKK